MMRELLAFYIFSGADSVHALGMLSIVIFRNLYFFLFFQLNVLNANNAQTITLRIDGCSNLDCMTYNVARATSLFPPDG